MVVNVHTISHNCVMDCAITVPITYQIMVLADIFFLVR